jgi:hypothetical protein
MSIASAGSSEVALSRRALLGNTVGLLAGALAPWRPGWATEFPLDAAEQAAGVIPDRLDVPPGVVTRYGAVGDGARDDTPAFQRALAVARYLGHARVPAGRYLVSSVRVPTSVILSGDAGAVIQKLAGPTYSHVLECIATLGSASPLAAPASRGSVTISITTASQLQAGTIVVVRDRSLAVAPYGRNQEINEVVAVSADTCVLRWPLLSDYVDHPELVPQLDPASGISIAGLRIEIPPGTAGGALYFDNAYRCTVSDCRVSGPWDQAGVHFWRSGRCDIMRCRIEHGQGVETPGLGYGVAISNSCHQVRAVGVQTLLVRENAISLGSRYCSFEDCLDELAHDSSFNTHADGNYQCSISRCTSLRSRGYGMVLGFEGSKAPEKSCSAHDNLIVDCAKNGIYCGADAGRENVAPEIEANTIVRPGRKAASFAAIRVVNARGAVVNSNQIYELSPGQTGISIATCTDATIRSNRGSSLDPTLLVQHDRSSSGRFEDNLQVKRAAPATPRGLSESD